GGDMRSNRHTRYIVAGAAPALPGAFTAGVATGAPGNAPRHIQLTLRCPRGATTGGVKPVHAEWGPAQGGSEHALIPVALREFIATATDADGNVLFTIDDAPLFKGDGAAVPQNSHGIVECTGDLVLDLPDGGRIAGSSTVTGFFANA